MSFLDIVRRARAYLHEQQRVSLRALRREFDLDDDALEELACELVDVQRVAVREGSVLVATAIQAAAPDATPTVATPSPEPADTERRQVTVLFCDLVGSTELSTRIDAEDFGEAIRAYHEAATQVVTRFGGYVAQLLGDGLGSRRRRRHVTSTRAIFRGRCRTSSGASSYTIPARMGLWRTRWDSMVASSSATMRPCVTCTLAIPTGRWL